MSKPITLQIRPRGKPIKSLPETVELPAGAKCADLYAVLAKQSKYSVHQLRVTKGSDGSLVANVRDGTVHSTGLRDQSTVYVKDLGPQIGWQTVFVIEYIGPVLIHPLIYMLAPYIYKGPAYEASQMQKTVLVAILAHFLKREFETLFVHRFSAATMPVRNVFKNSAHYWILSGVNMAYWLYAPASSAAGPTNQILLATGLALYGLGEMGNLSTHLTLRDLRSAGGGERGIPQGWLFDLVTCPNYLTEIISWIGVYLISGLNWSVLFFTVAAGGQMAAWASKKERRYRKEFGDKYHKKRYTMLPGIW
ncbi:uncharacterized protein HMPREF1541_11125 [Cyphellophora europaea CBS 101466]|uniref:very-long-chain enoyl-CoA reductase n=1 Tax=Cyphellophora europaea (strain CBS 101466) TaxID=1220924 RepID=W2S535_CYPE1|nr:uncharacterized protein HMPREF1541_11125 [Cyphellophora europaea CBS 101466]ETN43801.1 hypothetical protein HMPREF1541_11125 [Cyphellophora europaea CBS 101466]